MKRDVRRKFLSSINMNNKLKDDTFVKSIYDCLMYLNTSNTYSVSIADTNIGKSIKQICDEDNAVIVNTECPMYVIYEMAKYKIFDKLIKYEEVELRCAGEYHTVSYTLPRDLVVVWSEGAVYYYSSIRLTIKMRVTDENEGKLNEQLFIIMFMCYCLYHGAYGDNKGLRTTDIFNKVYTKVLAHFDAFDRSYGSYAKENWPCFGN